VNSVHLEFDRLMPSADPALSGAERRHLDECPACWYDAQVLSDVYADVEPPKLAPIKASRAAAPKQAQATPLDRLAAAGPGITFADFGEDLTVSSNFLPGGRPELADLEMKRWIGNGLTGPVYEVHSPVDGTQFAAKLLSNVDAETAARIRDEFAAYEAIEHGRLVSPLYLDQTTETDALIFPLADGEPIEAWLGLGHDRPDRDAAVVHPPAALWRVMIDITTGLLELHARGLVHGHLGPMKVLVDADGRARLCEAGLWAADTPSGRPDPWAEYIAPECRGGGERTAAGDWYAFGVLVDLMANAADLAPAMETMALDLMHPDPNARPTGSQVLERLMNQRVEMAGHAGRYVDMGPLGTGGMAEVRRVRDPNLRRQVALKAIRPELVTREMATSRFRAEAQIMAQLQHPGIVPVHDMSTLPDGRICFTMKEIEGETLGDLIGRFHHVSSPARWGTVPNRDGGHPWTFNRIMGAVQRVCETMAFAHARGVIHRDLKPNNIMLGGYGEVLVLDWGLAKVLHAPETEVGSESVNTARAEGSPHETVAGWIAGTPAYMPPEQALGQTDLVDERSDVYALGALIYHLLTGDPPYRGKSSADVIKMVRKGPPSSLTSIDQALDGVPPERHQWVRQARARIPEALAEICETAMARDSADRYQSAAELGRALVAWQEGEQQREAAMAALETAEAQRAQGRAHLAQAARLEAEAAAALEAQGVEAEAPWTRLESAEEARQRGELCELEYANGLQNALVQCPGLSATHRALAALYRAQGQTALKSLDAQGLRRAKGLLAAHLSHLPGDDDTLAAHQRWLKQAAIDPGASVRRETAFVGRGQALDRLASLSAETGALVTVVGAAGVGKTRLVREHGASAEQQYPGGVHFVDLSESDSLDSLIQRVGEGLDLALTGGDPIERIGLALAGRGRVLMILDNLDRVAAHFEATVARWRTMAPEATLLVTSRVGLPVKGAQVLTVGPMSLFAAMALFTAKAQVSRPGFSLGPHNRGMVAKLVDGLDRLPLAIELAASRVSIMSLAQLTHRLEDQLVLLAGGGRTDQQRALLGALDCSWELLDQDARSALTQAGVFRGGFELGAAQAVIQLGDTPDTGHLLDVLQSLEQDHLVRTESRGHGQIRYFMYASIRAFVQQKERAEGTEKTDTGDAANAAEARHAAYYGGFGTDDALEALELAGGVERRRALEPELDNLAVAARRVPDIGDAAGCALAASALLHYSGPLSLGAELLEAVLDHPQCTDLQRMRLAQSLCRFQEESAEREVRIQTLERALEIARAWGNQRYEGILLGCIAGMYHEQAQPEPAKRFYDQALSILAPLGATRQEAIWRGNLGNLQWRMGDLDPAQTSIERAHALSAQVGDTRQEALTQLNLGRLAALRGEPDLAKPYFLAALEGLRHIGHRRFEAMTLNALANLEMDLGRRDAARAHYEAALSIHRQSGSTGAAGIVQGNLGELLLESGDVEAAVAALRTAVKVCDENYPTAAAEFRGPLAMALARLGQTEEALALVGTGEAFLRDGGFRPALARLLCAAGQVYLEVGNRKEAREAMAEARRLASALGAGPMSELGQAIEQLRQRLT